METNNTDSRRKGLIGNASRAACAVLSCALLFSGCTYPFDIDYEDDTRIIVFSGDIVVGGETVIYGYLTKGFGNPEGGQTKPYNPILIDGSSSSYFDPSSSQGSSSSHDPSSAYYGYDTIPLEGYLESEDGSRIEGNLEKNNGLNFDTSGLDINKKYRICLKNTSNGSEYRSSWSEVMGAPVIDSLSYYIDHDNHRLVTRVSVTAQDTPYISLTSSYSWRVSPWAKAYFDYQLPTETDPFGIVILGNNYPENCYTINDDHVKTFATVTMKEGKLVNYDLDSFDRYDRTISGTLRLRMKARQISKESYLYWQNLEKTSSMTGDLFTPTPSSMRGNISNIDDKAEMVLGYIGISRETSKDLYIRNADHMLYRESKAFTEQFYKHVSEGTVPQNEWFPFYKEGMRPWVDVYSDMGFFLGYRWIDKRCLDCTFAGGIPDKPEDWIE